MFVCGFGISKIDYGLTALDVAKQMKNKELIELLSAIKPDKIKRKEFLHKFGLTSEELNQILRSNIEWNRSRLMLVGKGQGRALILKNNVKGRSGKSALYNSLRNVPFIDTASTVVADVEEVKISRADVKSSNAGYFVNEKKNAKDHARTLMRKINDIRHKKEEEIAERKEKMAKKKKEDEENKKKREKAKLEKRREEEENKKKREKAKLEKRREEEENKKAELKKEDLQAAAAVPKKEVASDTKMNETNAIKQNPEKANAEKPRPAETSKKTPDNKPKQQSQLKEEPEQKIKETKTQKSVDLAKKMDYFNIGEEDNEMRLTVWDYAGQTVFYTTHKVFLGRNCFYVIVFSIKEWISSTNEEAAQFLLFWLQSIRSYASGASFAIVGTHMDSLVERERENRQKINQKLEEISKEIECILQRVFFGAAHIPWSDCRYKAGKTTTITLSFFPVDNTKSGSPSPDNVVPLLRKSIHTALAEDSFVQQQIPMMWTKVYDILKEKDANLISVQKITELAAEWVIPEKDVKPMLSKFHDLGVAVYFNEEGLDSHAILNPMYLLNKLKNIIFDEKLHETQRARREKVGKSSKGIFTAAELEELVWAGTDFKKDDHDFIINVLKRHMIICPWGEKEFMVPCMLQENAGNSELPECESPFSTNPRFTILFPKFKPHSYFEMLLASILTNAAKAWKEFTGETVTLNIQHEELARTEAIFRLSAEGENAEANEFRIAFQLSSPNVLTAKRKGPTRHLNQTEDAMRSISVVVLGGDHTMKRKVGISAREDSHGDVRLHCATVLELLRALAKNVKDSSFRDLESPEIYLNSLRRNHEGVRNAHAVEYQRFHRSLKLEKAFVKLHRHSHSQGRDINSGILRLDDRRGSLYDHTGRGAIPVKSLLHWELHTEEFSKREELHKIFSLFKQGKNKGTTDPSISLYRHTKTQVGEMRIPAGEIEELIKYTFRGDRVKERLKKCLRLSASITKATVNGSGEIRGSGGRGGLDFKAFVYFMWTEFRSSAGALASVSNIMVETEQPNSAKPSISRTRVFRDALHRWIGAFKQPVLEEEKIRNYLKRLGQDMDQNIIHIVFAGDPRKHRCLLGEVRRGVKSLLSKTASSRLVKIHEWRNSYFKNPSVFCYSGSIAGNDDGNDGTSPPSPKKIESRIELKEKRRKKIGESSLDYNSLDGTDEKSSLGVDDSVRGVASTRKKNAPAKGHLKRLCERINNIIRLYAAKLENETKSTPRRTFVRFVVSEIGALILLASLKHELSPSSRAKRKDDVKNREGASEEESTLVQNPIPLSLRCLGAVNVVLFVDQTKQWQNQEAETKTKDAGEKVGKQRLLEDFKSLAKKFGKMRKERVWEVRPKPFEFLEGNPEFLERMERTKVLKNRRNKMSSWITFHIETVTSGNRSATTPRTATESGSEKKTVVKGEQEAEQKQLLDSVQDARTFLEEFGFAICLFEDPIKWNKRYLFRPLAYDSLSPLESFSSSKAKVAPKSGVQKWFENWKSGWESTVPLRSASPDISLHRSLALQGRQSPSSSMSVFGEVEADNNTLRRLVLNRDCLILGYDEDSKECVYEVAFHLAQSLLPLKGESIRRNSNSGKDLKGRYQQQPKGGQGLDEPDERKFDPRIILIDLDKNEADPGIFQSQSPPVAVVMTPELYAFIDFFQDYRQHHRSAGRDGDPNDGLSNEKGGLPHKMGKKKRQKLRSSTAPGSWLGFHGPPPSLLEKIKLLFTPEYLNHKTLLEAILNELKRRALRRKIREMKPRRVVPSQAQNQHRANGLHRPNSCLVFKNKGLGSHFQEKGGKESQRSLPSSSLRSSPSSGSQLLATHVLVNPKVWREKKLKGIAIGLLPTDNWDSKWSHSLGTLDSLLEKIDIDNRYLLPRVENRRNGRSLSDDILTALTQREGKRRKMKWQLVQPRSRVEVLSRFEVERPLLGVKVVSRKDFPDYVKLGRGDRMHANTTKILKKPSPIIENLEQNGGRCLSACWKAMVCGNGKSGKIHPEEMEKKETANRHEDEALPMSNRNDSGSLRKRNHKTSGPQAKSKGSTKARSSPKSSKDKKRASVHGPWMTSKEKAGTTEIDTKHELGSREGKGGRMEHEEGYQDGLTFFDSSIKVQTGDTSSETDAGYWPAFGHTNLVAVRYDYDEDIFLNPSSERTGNCGRFEEKVFTQAQVLLPPSDEEMLLFIKPLFERGTPTSVKEKVEDLLSKSMHILGIDAASTKNGFVLGTITAMEAYQPADFVLYSDKYLNMLPVVEKVVPVRPQCPRHMDIWEDFRRCFHTTERIQAGVVEYMGCAGISRGFATLQMSVFLNLSKDRAFHLKTPEGKDEKEQKGRPEKAEREEIPPLLSYHQGGEIEDEVHRQRSDRLKSNDTSVFLSNQDDSGAVSERICARIFAPDKNWSVRRLDASLRVSQAFLPEISGALRFNHLLSPGDAGERNYGGESSDGQLEVWNTRKLEEELRKLAQWNSRSKEQDKKFVMAPLPLLLLLHTDDDGVSAYDTSFNSAPTDAAATKIGSVNAYAHSVFRFVAKYMRKAIDGPRCRFATLNIRRNMIVSPADLKNYQSIAQLLPCYGSKAPPLLYAFSWPKEEDKEEDWKGNRQDLMVPDWTSEYNIWQNPYNLAELLGQYLSFDEEEKWRVVQEMKNTYDLSDTMVLEKFTPSRNLFYWLLLHFFYGDVCRSQLEHCLGLKGKSDESGTADVMSALNAVRVVLLSYTANEAIKTALYYSDVDELQGIGDAEVKACLFAALLPMFEEGDTAFSRLFGDLLASNSSLPPELHTKMTRNYNRRSTSELHANNEDGFLDEDNLTENESVQDVLVRQIDEVVGWYMRDKDVHPYIEHIIGLATSTKHGTSSTKNAQNNNTFRKLSLAFLYVISVRHMLQRLERLGEPAAKAPKRSKFRSACLTWMLRELSRRLQRRVLKLTNRNSSAYIKPPTHPAHNLIVGLMLVFSIFIIPILPLIQYSKAKVRSNE
eukprot:jgi/Bigna1/84406/fgenesh1_pg.134_\